MFLKLRRINSHHAEWINMDRIASFEYSDSGARLWVKLDDEDEAMIVNETPEQIVEMMKQNDLQRA